MPDSKKKLYRINEIQYIRTYYTVAVDSKEALNQARTKKVFFIIQHSPHIHSQEPEKVVEEVTDFSEFNLVSERFPDALKEVQLRK